MSIIRRLAPVVFSLLFSGNALAAPRCVVFSSQAQGTNGTLVPLEVALGHGLNVNFIPTGETITKVWIDDQSRVGASFDGNLCQWTSQQQAQCKDGGATVIHLRQTELIKIPDLPRSKSGSTLLSAVAQGVDGRKLYQFSVSPISNQPACSSITIVPDPPRLDPLASTSLSSSNQALLPATAASSIPIQAINDADAAFRGLTIAKRNKRIAFDATMWKKTHSAINLLRQGMSQQEAASRANIPINVLTQLITWGQE